MRNAFVVALIMAALATTVGVRSAAALEHDASAFWIPESMPVAYGIPDGGFEPDGMSLSSDSELPGPPSTGRAVLYSLLLPGLGDWYTGNNSRAVVFFGIDAALWTGFFVSNIQADNRQESYEAYAVSYAGVDRTGHSDDYYALVREYDNSDIYEAEIKTDGRFEMFPNVGSEALDTYYLENRVTDFAPWEWTSLDDKVQFQEMRSSSKNSERRADFFVAGLIANRAVSAIITYVSLRTAEDAAQVRYQIEITPPGREYDATVMFTRRF